MEIFGFSFEMPDWVRKGRKGISISNKTLAELNKAKERGLEMTVDGDLLDTKGTPTVEVKKVVIKGKKINP